MEEEEGVPMEEKGVTMTARKRKEASEVVEVERWADQVQERQVTMKRIGVCPARCLMSWQTPALRLCFAV